MRRRRAAAAVALALCLAPRIGGAGEPEASDAVDAAFVAGTLDALAAVVEREYFDPQLASRLARGLREDRAAGRHDGVRSLHALAQALTRDLLARSGDRHLAVSVVRADSPASAPGAADAARALRGRRDNFGVRRLEILTGNVGYLELTAFYRPDEARGTIAAALRTLENADALILDLRHNGGGSPGTVALVASDLFDEPRLPLFEVVPRSGETTAYATEREPLARRDGARPVFVLTASGTFSAGEGLAFLLQERHRAEVIGERTAGAANPGRPYPLNDRLEATVPNGRVRGAVSGRNWEGTGVVPDVAVPADQALQLAHARALRALLAHSPGGAWAETLRQALAALGG